MFQSTRPVWAATSLMTALLQWMGLFQSTRPVWAATPKALRLMRIQLFQSTRPVWAATSFGGQGNDAARIVSIHAARVGRDLWVYR